MENIIQGKFRWVFFLGLFLILALPLLNLPPWFSPPDWGKTIIFRSILAVLLFIFLWQVLIFREQFSEKFSGGVKIGLFLLLGLFGISFLATIFSLDRNFSLWGSPYRSGGFVNFAFYIFFAILAFLILEKNDWQKIWDFTILIGILASIIAILQWQGLFEEILITYKGRPPSTIGGPIFLAIYLLLLGFLALSFGIRDKKIYKKIFYFGALLLFIFVLLLTYTRAAFLGLFVGILYFIFFYPKKLIWLKVLALVILILGIYGVYYANVIPVKELPEFIKENRVLAGFVNRLSIKRALEDPRIPGWKVAFEAVKDRPILGYGPENFSIGFDKFYDPKFPQIAKEFFEYAGWWDRAHNFILDISISAGIPALIIYLALFVVLFWQLERLKKDTNPAPERNSVQGRSPRIIAHGIQATFIAYLTANFFSFDTFSTYLISFLLIGYSLSLINLSTKPGNVGNPQGSGRGARLWEGGGEVVIWKLKKYKGVILALLFVLLVWFIWSFNIKPFQVNTEINRALSESKQGFCERAKARMEKVLENRSFLDNYLRLRYSTVIDYCMEEKPELIEELAKRATEILKENIKIRPLYTRNWLSLGEYTNILLTEKQKDLKDEANYYFEKANELSPRRQEVFIGWIKTDLLTGQYSNAEEKAQKCIDLNERLGDCWWLMGLTNIYLGEEKTAKENIEMARKKGFPVNSENSLLKLAKVYVDTENYQELLEIYQQLIKIKTSNPGYHISLMIVYKELGQFENAKKQALKIIELWPEYREEVEEFLKSLPE